MPPAGRWATPASRRIDADEDGFILVFLAVALPALLALVGLVIDGGRLLTLDSELANQADAAALAAARELDRSEGAIVAARGAAIRLTRSQRGPSERAVTLSFRFAPDLPSLQRNSRFSLPDEEGRSAAFVEVRAATGSITADLLAFVGATPPALRRRAVAESQHYACDVTPTRLCHAQADEFVSKTRPGRQFLLRYDGNVIDGSIALLDRPDASGRRGALLDLASDRPSFCFSDQLRLRTDYSPLEFDEAVNVRFDRYTGRAGPISPDLLDFPPAPNVIQGKQFESCFSPIQGGNTNPPYPLPRDPAYQGFRLSGFWNAGTGDWRAAPPLGGTGFQPATSLEEYLSWNHGDKGPRILDRLRGARTRWELYLAELGLTPQSEAQPVDTRSLGSSTATMPTGGPLTGSLAFRRERPFPICYAGRRPRDQARRRIVYLSIGACDNFAEGATAAELSRNVGKFFLTEPSEGGAVLAEYLGVIRPRSDDGKLRHVVQLVATE